MAKVTCRDERVSELCKKLGIDPSKTARIAIVIVPNDAVKAEVTLYVDPDTMDTINKLAWTDEQSRPESQGANRPGETDKP